MANNVFQDLMAAFREATKTTFEKHKESNAVKFIKNSITRIENIIKTIDKMLKKRNIDIGAMAKNIKGKGKELFDKAKATYAEAKQKGFLETAKAKANDIKSKLSNLFKKENETGTSPPETDEKSEKTESNKKENSSWFDKILTAVTTIGSSIGKALKSTIKPESLTEKEKKETEQNNIEAEKKSEKKESIFSRMFSRYKERAEKRRKEIEEEKKAVQENSKKKENKENNSWLDKILVAISAVGGFIKKSLGSLGSFMVKGITKSIGYLGGFVVKGLGKTITNIVPRLSSEIADITSKLLGKGFKGAVNLAGKGIKALGRLARPFAGSALRLAGRAALAIASGPVGWIAGAAAIGLGGYELYKYFTRNDISDDLPGKLTRLRLLMYGFNDTKKEHYHKIFKLEMLMKDHIKFNNYKVVVDKLNEDDINEILDIFELSKNEEDKEKYAIFNNWFAKRFMPAYKVFMQAMWSVNNSIYLDEIDKFKPADLYSFVTRINIPTIIYDINQVPTFEDTNVYHTKTQVDDMLINIINTAKEQANIKDSDIAKKIAEENKRAKDAAARKQQQQLEQNKNERNKAAPPPPKQPSIDTTPGESDSPLGKQKSGSIENIEVKATAKLNKASGELYPGTTSLEGITSYVKKEKIYNLDPNVRELFTGMAREYHYLTGKNIPVVEAFRSYEDQAALYAKDSSKAAKPGTSAHEFGLALDIDSVTADELDKLGLMRKYGFTRPIGQEDWHIEPIGVSLNATLAKEDLNHRFNAIQASPGRGGDGYGTLSNSEKKRRNPDYQELIYKKEDENIINPINVIKDSNRNLVPNLSMSNKPGETPGKTTESKPKITGESSPTGSKPNIEAKANIGNSNPDAEKKPTISNISNKPLEKSKSVVQTNPNTNIGKFAELSPEAAIKQAAKMTGMSEDTILAFAKMESSDKNSFSTGLFNVLKGNWDILVKKYGPKYGILYGTKPENNYYKALMAMEYAKEKLIALKDYKSAGIDDATAIYLAHHYGVDKAKSIIQLFSKYPNLPMKKIITGDLYKENEAAIGNSTVQEYVQKISDNNAVAKYTFKSIPTTDASKPSVNTETVSNDSVLQKAIPKSEPPSSIYKTVNTVSPVAEPLQAPPQQQNYAIDMKNTEALMTDQLNALNLIVKILTSIDGKFDVDILKQLAAGKTQPPVQDKSIPKGSINLSRKYIEA